MSDPPSEMNDDERQLLLNAYIDGETTPDERALVEADPELMSEAEELRAVKSAVGEVPTLPDDARQRFLGVATAEFRDRQSPADETPDEDDGAAPPLRPPAPRPTPVTSAQPAPPAASGRGWAGASRWIGAAAAIVLVVAGGVAVVSQSGGNGDDSSSGAAPAMDEQEGGASEATDGAGDQGSADRRTSAAANDAMSDTAESGQPSPSASGQPGGGAVSPDETEVGSARNEPSPRDVDVSTDRKLTRWFERVRAGSLTPPRAGERECGRTILGAASVGGDRVVVARVGDRVVTFDAATCEQVTAIDAP